jgi:hypothetical protein
MGFGYYLRSLHTNLPRSAPTPSTLPNANIIISNLNELPNEEQIAVNDSRRQGYDPYTQTYHATTPSTLPNANIIISNLNESCFVVERVLAPCPLPCFPLPRLGSWVLGLGSWVLGLGSWVLGLGSWVLGVVRTT